MSEPKAELEAALYELLSDKGWPVYNTQGAGATIEYIVFSFAGGDDDGYHLKDRGRAYEYQIVGISLDRNTSLVMNATIDAAMGGAKEEMTLSGQGVVQVARVGLVDYPQVLDGGQVVYYVGGIYLIELEEA